MSNGKNPKVAVAASANAVSGTGEPAVNGYYYLDGKLPSSACSTNITIHQRKNYAGSPIDKQTILYPT